MSALHVVTDRQWMVDELSQNTLFPVVRSLGLDVPKHSTHDLWWIPQGIANRFLVSGVSFNFSAPGSSWLPNLSRDLTKREIKLIKVKDLNSVPNVLRFWKFAEAKVDFMLADKYTTEELSSILKNNNVPDESILQYSDIVDIENEFRFFISDKKIKAFSPYLNRESGKEVIYYDSDFAQPKDTADAYDFAASIAPILPSPRGYALDVASLRDGSFIVLEANPAWCSAWYGSEINGVVKAIWASHNDLEEWAYTPDPLLVEKYSKMMPLKWR